MSESAANVQTLGEVERPRYLILGTAGHIDHGKTSLVKALTGVDTDRLPEERRRGMTIDLGFAELVLEPFHFGVVDVPGHERFVRTMVAGATGIDLAMLAVAGDDSVMPQTVEHVEVLDLIGIRHGVVAITKCDLVDGELLDFVEEEVRDLLAGTGLEGSPIVRVSSTTGEGLEALRRVLFEAAGVVVVDEPSGVFRMAIDRVFSVQGRGTVVTGSVTEGEVRSGETLEVQPAGLTCRVRDVQCHGRDTGATRLGQRAAINLMGVDRDVLGRGQELVTPGLITPSHRIDAEVHVLKSCKHPIKAFSRVRVCMGTREVLARIVPLARPVELERSVGYARSVMAADWRGFVQLRSGEKFVGVWGQRFILREENSARTVGGGVVLRPVARRWSTDRDVEASALGVLLGGDLRARVSQVVAEAGFAPLSGLGLCARTGIVSEDAVSLVDALAEDEGWAEISGRRVSPAVLEGLFVRADRRMRRFHEGHAESPGMGVDSLVGWFDRRSARGLGRLLFERYVDLGRVVVRGRFVALKAFAPKMSQQDEKLYVRILGAFEKGAYQPPTVDVLGRELDSDVKRVKRLVTVAVAFGDLVGIDGTFYLLAEHERKLRETVAEMVRAGDGVSLSEVRERLGSSRKYTVPLMEHLDRVGFTRRDGDRRVLCDGVKTGE